MEADALVTLLGRIGITGQIGANGWLRALCPYHLESRPSWGINTTESPHGFSCFTCHATGTLYRLLVDKGNFTEEAAKRIAKIPDRVNSESIQLEQRDQGMWVIDETELFPFRLNGKGANYLAARGIGLKWATKAGVVYEPLLKRVLFPWKFRAKLYGVTGRSIKKDDPFKTMPLYGTQKGNLLYLPFGGFLPRRFPLILCEGEIDALKISQSGFTNVAAFGFGTITQRQAKMISENVEKVICFFDEDDTGGRLEYLVHQSLEGTVELSSINWEGVRGWIDRGEREKLDPGNMARSEIQRALAEVRNNSDWPEL